MNFLAHFFLSREKEPWVVGNFLADYLRPAETRLLPDDVREGIALHLEIDRMTDVHPRVREAARRLMPRHGKYAPVVLDVFYDYFLIKNWARYTPSPLTSFTREIYDILLRNDELMPAYLRERLHAMVKADWLHSYGHPQGLDYAFQRMARRMSRPELIADIMGSHQLFYQEMDEDFNAFFPDLAEGLKAWKQNASYPSK
jgi:acyl carrier protein phosphodiesterase